ncbi:MAG: TnsA endonuclease N-terminal domain-containing protein [bacterium]
MIAKRGTLTNLRKSPLGKEDYDSSLERQYMVELERDPAVKSWTKKHGIKIPYKFFGLVRNYLPDFLVEYKDGSKEVHETKGLPLLLWLSTKIKGETAEKYCLRLGWKYKLITKGDQAFYRKV